MGELDRCARGCDDPPMPIGKVVAVIFFVKIPGLAGYMYFQQRALGYGLMLVGAIFPTVSVMASVSISMAFFGDKIFFDGVLAYLSLAGLLAGLVLLSQPAGE
jgi:hypothetical protein